MRSQLTLRTLAISVLVGPFVETPAALATLTFTPLGAPAGFMSSNAYGLSGNGRVVIGYGNTSQSSRHAVRWEEGFGWLNLGGLPGYSASFANATNFDGSVVVGNSHFAASGDRAFRWTASTGLQDLGALPGATITIASAVSHDGTVVVGSSGPVGGGHVFRWTAETGMVDLGVPPGANYATAYDISADGRVVVGLASFPGQPRGFRWTAETGFTILNPLVPGARSGAYGISPDGEWISGNSEDGERFNSVFWHAGPDPQRVGSIPFETNANLFDISNGGATAVGTSHANLQRATIWTPSLGCTDLNTYLPGCGVPIGDRLLISASGVSDDGTVIAGWATGYSVPSGAWIVRGVPAPGALAIFACAGLLARARLRRKPGLPFAYSATSHLTPGCTP